MPIDRDTACENTKSNEQTTPFLKRVVDSADLGVLRIVLYQLTKDPELAHMKLAKVPVRGGAYMMDSVAPEHHEVVKRKALEFLERSPKELRTPSCSEVSELLHLYHGRELDENAHRFAVEELAFEQFPRDVSWHSSPPSEEVLKKYHVIIVGAGISGITAGIMLKRLGIPFTIIERQKALGGVWEANAYPGARVDVTSFIYQYKFVKDYRWKDYYATGSDNQEYLRYVADEYNIFENIRFGVEVTSAEWNESGAFWSLTCNQIGKGEESLTAQIVISAAGLFNKAKISDISGIEQFQGEVFHTTQWKSTYDVSEKRVAIIGNGSTGVQILPGIADSAKCVTVMQRTPQWMTPLENYFDHVPEETNWLFDHLPFYWNWFNYSKFSMMYRMQDAQYYDDEWVKSGGKISKINDDLRSRLTDYIKMSVKHDEALIEKLVPEYAPTSRRMVVDSGWYEALTRRNVDLVTSAIDSLTERGIRTADGVERDFDIIILATGFEVAQYLWPVDYCGARGLCLSDIWRDDGPRAYLGITMPDFPNLFIFYGPNAQPRVGSFHSWAETWARYILEGIVLLIENNLKSIECRRIVFERYNEDLDQFAKKVIWDEGKGGYHLNKKGRPVIHASWPAQDFHASLAKFNPDDYELSR